MCFGWTEPHYATFDEAAIHFQGVGLFVMSQRSSSNWQICGDLPDFQVLVDQEYRGNSTEDSFIRAVMLVLPRIVTIHIGPNRRMNVVIIIVNIYSPYIPENNAQRRNKQDHLVQL